MSITIMISMRIRDVNNNISSFMLSKIKHKFTLHQVKFLQYVFITLIYKCVKLYIIPM